MNLTIKLRSVLIQHGQSEVRESTQIASVGKLQNLLKLKSEGKVKEDLAREVKPINHKPVDYLTNTSSTRSHLVYDGEFHGDFGKIRDHARALLNLASVDFNARKLEYKEFKDSLQEELVSKYGSLRVLPEAAAKDYQHALHKRSFKVWKHQLTFIVWDTEQFEGGTYDSHRGIWVAATVSKAVYTSVPLTKGQLELLEGGSKSITNTISKVVAKTMVRDFVNGKSIFRPLREEEDLDDFL
jgi:hypothetical protein